MRDLEGDREEAAGREGGSRHRGPAVALCGSSDLEHYPDRLVEFIEARPTAKLLLRSGNKSDPGLFERVMAKLAATLWMDVQWCRPNPEDGKAGVFLRDVEMVRQADVVLAYFSTTEMSGGTAHVVEKAIDQEVPVYAYGFNGSAFERIGEHDVADAWAEAIQAELG